MVNLCKIFSLAHQKYLYRRDKIPVEGELMPKKNITKKELEIMLEEEKKKVEELERKLKEENDRSSTYWDRILRMQADFENYQKNMEKTMKEFERMSNERIIKDLLEDLENIERAMEYVKNRDNDLYVSLKLIRDHFLSTLEKYGLEIIETVGKRFDPYLHEAVMVEDGDQDNIVVEEFSRGYRLNGKVIKPSRVKVIRKR
ncbi:MAG TPA: nucleotide exchange factor GrpE [Euryarchaeota archaeon]|jgi:molecular chaperone GrpE|nr:nucleotide exchange factor GrpE [Thermoplasmatales archaeon]PMP73874.1 MAG: nucleotide exchange factor GrpE [Aciduliprofundum sp.]HEU12755.1 nucleotide exchange factor GrpE [Euryarchaeota archaeon]